jgi:hypothetical protein
LRAGGEEKSSGHFPREVYVFIIDHDFKAGAQSGEVGALRGGVSIDGLNRDPSDRLKLAGEKVAQITGQKQGCSGKG